MTKALWAFLALSMAACSLPVNPMTPKERKADMEWAFTVFEHNYAPMDLKKDNFGLDYQSLKSDCVELAQEEMDNPSFLRLFQKCIHSFKDAHVGAQQMNNGLLPEYAQVAHLGFFTMRTKAMIDGIKANALRIVTPLKGSDNGAAPLVPGDLILRVNGQYVGDYLKEEIVPFIDVGQSETNLTNAAFRFGVRTSIDMPLPEDDDIELVVARGSMVFTIVLPWIVEDMLSFQLKQNPPEEETEEIQSESPFVGTGLIVHEKPTQSPPILSALSQHFFGYSELQNILKMMEGNLHQWTDRLQMIAHQGFQVMKFNPVYKELLSNSLFEQSPEENPLEGRNLPLAANVDDLMSEPQFTAKVVSTNDNQQYAYIKITNFPADDKILSEWHRAMTAIEDKGIKSVIIDMIDNGGGSLIHGLRMANMLRQKSLKFPTMQVRLNNNWMNSFKSQAAFSESDYQKAIARKVVKQLEEDQQAGLSISRPFSVTVMDPFFLQNPMIGLSDDVKVALMVNEICVSMCDIFASIFKENQMGVVIGQRTMGGGGNVTQHGVSPVSKVGLSLTESLIISPNGQYIEDAGVTPNVEVDMVEDREKGFATAFMVAFDAIMAQ